MAEIDLTQHEADRLMAMEKHPLNDSPVSFPRPGDKLAIPLQSVDRREAFVVDVTRSSIKLTKGTFQNRARQVIVLLRLDIDGAPHRNPDGEEVPCPHLHVYKESFADKWAIPVPSDLVPPDGNLFNTLSLFLKRCNVPSPPPIQNGLF